MISPPPRSDPNSDCRTNLLDLAIVASDWLACGLSDHAARSPFGRPIFYGPGGSGSSLTRSISRNAWSMLAIARFAAAIALRIASRP